MSTLVVMGVGDVGPIHEPIDKSSKLAKPILDPGRYPFRTVRTPLSERGSAPGALGRERQAASRRYGIRL